MVILFITRIRIDAFVKSQKNCHCEQSEAIFYEIATLARRSASARRHVAPLLAMTRAGTFYDFVKD